MSRIDGAVGTVFGTVTWNRLEDAVHAPAQHGELSVEQINEQWEIAARAMNGDAVDLTPGFRTWWSYVPHFVAVPGYMYAYAFGYLLSLSIYERYREEGDALVEPILDMLRAGSSDSTVSQHDSSSISRIPQFWHRGLDAIEQLVVEAEALALRPPWTLTRYQVRVREPREQEFPFAAATATAAVTASAAW